MANAATRTYEVTITGKTPLLLHWDNIDWADEMDEWKSNPANKKNSKAGDDRTPAWRWIGSAYHDGAQLAIPSDNIMRCLMEGGAMVPVPGAKGNKTFKSQSQSGMAVAEPYWPIAGPAGLVPLQDVNALRESEDFKEHRARVRELGFELFVKRAKVGMSKHIRVRPRFNAWSISGRIHVWDEQITTDVLRDILTYGGQFKGLCDWRPGGKTPGSYGMFEASVNPA